jgi:hypothetical protein
LTKTQQEGYAQNSEGYAMSISYLTDDKGRRSAIVIPIEQWDRLAEKLARLDGGIEMLTSEDDRDRDLADRELASGEALDLAQAIDSW